MPSASNPESDRKEADAPLPEAQPRPEVGTLPEVLGEIRTILRGLDGCGGEGAPPPEPRFAAAPGNAPAPRRIAPARSLPEALYKESLAALGLLSDGAVEKPDSVPAVLPEAAPDRRRNRAAVAALAVSGLVVLAAAGLAVTQGPKLAHRGASAAGQNRSPAGAAAKAAIRVPLPPPHSARIVKSAAAPSPPAAAPKAPAAIRPAAPAPEPRSIGTAARSPPAAQAPPAIAPAAEDRPQTESRGRTIDVAAIARNGAGEASPDSRSHQVRRYRDRHRHRILARRRRIYRRPLR